jgi:endonuclease YncB( thermonuclease family)
MRQQPKSRLIAFFLFAVLVSFTSTLFAKDANLTKNFISGKVIGIADGDTVTVLTEEHEQYKVRLAGIDCPEKAQAFGNLAKKTLSKKVFSQNVRIENRGIDQYGRTLGIVIMGDIDINEYMILQGVAWHYKKYANTQPQEEADRYSKAEDIARNNKKGLWIQDNPTPPWQFRAEKKNKPTQ